MVTSCVFLDSPNIYPSKQKLLNAKSMLDQQVYLDFEVQGISEHKCKRATKTYQDRLIHTRWISIFL